MSVKLTILGSGDAFGSGGRFNTCLLIDAEGRRLLVDCGASSLVALRRAGIRPEDIDAILLSHLHGDHFGAIPFLLLDTRHNAPRTSPWVIAGPTGVSTRVFHTLDLLFPGAGDAVRERVSIEFIEWVDRIETPIGPVHVTPVPVVHPSGASSYGLRVRVGDRVFAYSGDTQWTESLVELARGTDLFICECYTHQREVPYHLNYTLLREKQPLLATKRLVLTHMGAEMLARIQDVATECAFDGLEIEL